MSATDPRFLLTVKRTVALIPLWILRAYLNRGGGGLLLIIVLDIALALLHLRAIRPAESIPTEWFGNNSSWTNCFYVPGAFALGSLVFDLWDGYKLIHHP